MYKFQNTEKNNETSAEYETKSLLYLLSMRKDSNEIDMFAIDCFNDITGTNGTFSKLWDVQSKGVKSLTPNTVGKALFTLFENFSSEIEFNHFILFIPKLKEGYLINENLINFEIANFIKEEIENVKIGLINEYKRRKNINQIYIDDLNRINKFIKVVSFVIAEKEKEVYIKNIIQFKDKDFKTKKFFEEIFNEIRDRQSTLKNICIEGVEIEKTSDVEKYNKILRKKEIEILIINRLVGADLFKSKTIPIFFNEEVNNMEPETIIDILQKCNEDISKTLFNKNCKNEFWKFLEEVVKIVRENRQLKVREIKEKIPKEIIKKIHTLDDLSVKYFIAVVKGGIFDENK